MDNQKQIPGASCRVPAAGGPRMSARSAVSLLQLESIELVLLHVIAAWDSGDPGERPSGFSWWFNDGLMGFSDDLMGFNG